MFPRISQAEKWLLDTPRCRPCLLHRNGCWLTTERRVEMDWTVVLTQKQPDSCSECKWLSCICEKAQEASNMFAVPLKEFPCCTCLSIGLFHYIRLGSQYHPRCFCAFRIWTQTLARCPTAKKWTECCIHLYSIYIEREHDIAHIGMLIYCFLLEYFALTHSRVTVVKSLFSPLLKVWKQGPHWHTTRYLPLSVEGVACCDLTSCYADW